MATVEILLPHGEVSAAREIRAARPDSLAQLRVGFLDNELWRSMGLLADELGAALEADCDAVVGEVMRSGPAHGSDPDAYRARLEELSGRVDAVISGLGN